MLIKVPAGEHQVVFDYYTAGLKEGIIVSIICWIAFVGVIIYSKRTKNGRI